MRRIELILAVLIAAVGFATEAATSAPPWRVPSYTLTAREMPVREALDTFGVAQGVPVVSSAAVKGVYSGDMKDVPAGEFLDRLATINNLIWYYDGATIFVYAGSEVQTMLMDLRYMKAGEVRALLAELGVEDKRFPIKTASNDEMIMVSGPPRYVLLVAEMIARADKLREQRTFTEIETRIFPLKYTWADNVSFSTGSSGESSQTVRGVADLLRDLMGSTSSERGTKEGTNTTTGAEVNFTPVIRPENRLNAVLVRDVSSRMPIYEKFIREVDKPQKLIEVDVTVLEMSRSDALDWQASLGVSGKDGKNNATAGMNADNLLSSVTPSGAGAMGGYSYLGEHVNVDASVAAVKSDGRARSVSRTSLLTLNNMTVEISDTQSYSSKLIGEKVASVNETSAGTRLAVKPRVVEMPAGVTNEKRRVWLTMKLEDGGLDLINTVDGLPTKRTTTLTTQAELAEGGSLMLAGSFSDVEDEAGWGIPYLRDIPWIGWIFGGQSNGRTTIQRLFLITPHVVTLDYHLASTQDVTHVQLLRNRDLTDTSDLEEDADNSDLLRRDREAEVKENRDIRHENSDETFKRNEAERDLRRDQRKDQREADHKTWEDDFKLRKEEFERNRK